MKNRTKVVYYQSSKRPQQIGRLSKASNQLSTDADKENACKFKEQGQKSPSALPQRRFCLERSSFGKTMQSAKAFIESKRMSGISQSPSSKSPSTRFKPNVKLNSYQTSLASRFQHYKRPGVATLNHSMSGKSTPS